MDGEGARRLEKAVMPELGSLTTEVNPPEGKRFWLEESMLPSGRLGQIKPTFKIGEVAKTFFARSPDWLRGLGTQQEREGGVFELDGEPLEFKRTDSGARIYTLVDVERLAHALLEHRKIDVQQFVSAINIMRWMAYAYRVLKPEDMKPTPPPPEPEAEQLPIPQVDEEIVAAQERTEEAKTKAESQEGYCDACASGEHGDCETAVEIATRAWKGQTVLQVGNACRCYTRDPKAHQ